jgi:histidine phosphotransferase ChpT
MVDDASSDTRPHAVNARALRLAELLTARLCHDLSGALGTVVGALEMARDDPSMAADALPLAGDASRELSARLRLLRAAWADGIGGMLTADLLNLLQGMSQARRLRIDAAQLDQDAAFTPNGGRLLLNVLMVAAESLPRGGLLTISGSPTGQIVVAIDGAGAAWPPGFAACLAEEAAAWEAVTDARRLQAPLTALIAWSSALPVTMLLPSGSNSGAPPPLLLDLSGTAEIP